MKNNLKKAIAVLIIVAGLFLTSASRAQNSDNNQGTSAISVPINAHGNIASDSYGNIFIADADNNKVLMVNTNGVISTFAGTGTAAYSGDGGQAVSASLNYPTCVAADTSGNIYIADTRNNLIRMVNLQGIITTVAGNGTPGFSGDEGPAVNASLNQPTSVAVDANKNIYISDNHNNRVRMVDATSGNIYTIAGNGASVFNNNNNGAAPVQEPRYAPAPQPVTYQSYYDQLSPYGQWVNTPSYGNVWVPAAGAGFVPYSSAGHWVFTSYGWTWVSDYSWGWCAFHYGRWDYDNFLGWYWVPGNVWAPAWVSWRSGNGYYGWAPLPPAYGSVSERNYYNIPSDRYMFVQNQYMASPDVYHHYEPRERSVTYINNTTIVNRTYYDNETRTTCYAGPSRDEVERYSGAPVKVYTLNTANKPVQNEDRNSGALTLYRPKVQSAPLTASAAKAPVPAHVYTRDEIKPVAERPVITRPVQAEEAPKPAPTPQPHTEVTPNRTPENTQPHSDAPNRTPENVQPNRESIQPNREVNTNQTPPQNSNRPGATTPNNQPVKKAPATTQINDKQVGKDVKGHVIYQDRNGNKYVINNKGAKVAPKATGNPKQGKHN